jgi:hypothetical protein
MVVRIGRFAKRPRFVPLAGAVVAGEAIRTPHRKSVVAGTPEIDPDDQLSDAAVLRIYGHYGRPLDGYLETEVNGPPEVKAPRAVKPAPDVKVATSPDEAGEQDEPDASPIADRVLGYLTPPR